MKNQTLGVIGHPIGHTMSPFINRELFRLERISGEYAVYDIEKLEESIDKLKELDAFNITIPYKERIIPYIDILDEKAALFGSVNTVKVADSKLYGYTTDGIGFVKALAHKFVKPSGEILILGNGGAARAMAFELAYINADAMLTFACRDASLDKANSLVKEINDYSEKKKYKIIARAISYEELETEVKEYNILANATSVGMYPNTNKCAVSEGVIRRCNTVFDAVYNPYETKLIEIAKKLSKNTIEGMYMLIFQAIAAHEIWYDEKISNDSVDIICMNAKTEMENIFI